MITRIFTLLVGAYLCTSCWSKDPNANNPMIEPLDKRTEMGNKVQPVKLISQTKQIALFKSMELLEAGVAGATLEATKHDGEGTVTAVTTYSNKKGLAVAKFEQLGGTSFKQYWLEAPYVLFVKDAQKLLLKEQKLVYVANASGTVELTESLEQLAESLLATSTNIIELIEE